MAGSVIETSSRRPAARVGRLLRWPVERSSMTETSAPSSARAVDRCDPMKPYPPVTRARLPWKKELCSDRQSVSGGIGIAQCSKATVEGEGLLELAVEGEVCPHVLRRGGAHAAELLLWLREELDAGADER